MSLKIKKTLPILKALMFPLVAAALQGCTLAGMFDEDAWEPFALSPTLALPLGHSEISVGDLLKFAGTANLSEKSGEPLTFLYEKEIKSLGVNGLAGIPNVSHSESYAVGAVKIADQKGATTMTLGDILAGSGINNGFTPFPAATVQPNKQAYLSPMDQIENVVFESGLFELKLTNPFDAAVSVDLELKNPSGGLLASVTFTNIPAKGGSLSKTIDLAGKLVAKDLKINVAKVSTAGNAAGTVRYADELKFELNASKLYVKSGSFYFKEAFEDAETDELNLAASSAGVEFHKARMKTGILEMQIKSSFPIAVSMKLTLPSVTQNGAAVSKTIAIGAKATATASIDLSGVSFDFTKGSNGFNNLPAEITYKAEATGNLLTFNSLDGLDIAFAMKNLSIQTFEGFLGDRVIDIETGTSPIDLFGNGRINGMIDFADPKLSFNIINQYGIPSQLRFEKLEAVHNGGASKLPVILNPASPVNILSPGALGQSANTAVGVSNIREIFNAKPSALAYQISLRLNPGNARTANFFADTSKIKINMRAEIPFHGSVKDLIFTDTFDILTAQEAFSADKFGEAELRMQVENGIPLAFAQAKLLLLDAASNVLATIDLAGQGIAGAETSADGFVSASKKTEVKSVINAAQFTAIGKAKKAVFYGKVESSGGKNVKIKKSYALKIALGINVKLHLKSK